MALRDSFSGNESNSLDSELIITQRHVLINDDMIRIYRWVFLTVTCPLVTLCGIVTNIINIVCFAKQGFKQSVNVNLVGLTVSDLGSLIAIMVTTIGHNPGFLTLDLSFDFGEMLYLTVFWPHFGLSRVSNLITALITVERCLCITIPLKVKSFIKPKRVIAIIVCIYLVILGSLAPLYVSWELLWTYSPSHNRTILRSIPTLQRSITENISHIIYNTCVPCVAFVIITVCTGILVVQLKKKSKWWFESQTVHRAHDMSNRDRKITRMVVAISIFFIACYSPAIIILLAMYFSPEVTFIGHNFNISVVINGISLFLETVNSGFNIVIYYRMSRKYRETFRQIFRLSK